MRIFIHVLFLLGITGLSLLHSQESVILDEYVRTARANNLSMRSVDLQEQRLLSKVIQAKKRWQPSVDLNASYLLAEGGRSILFPVGDLFNPAYGTLNQLTGTEQFPTDLENFQTQLTPNNFIDANLSISKPLINSAIKYNIIIQETLVKLSEVERYMQSNEIAYQVKQAYFNHMKTIQGQKILNENINLLQEVRSFNKKLIKYDKATPDVISDIDYQITLLKSQIANLKEQNAITKTLFNTLLNRDLDKSIEVDTAILNNVTTSMSNVNVMIREAMDRRPELKKLIISDEINEVNKTRIDRSGQPSLGLRGAIGVQSEDFSFDDGGPLYTLGLSMVWNIWDGGLRKSQLHELQLEKEEIHLNKALAVQQITIQITQAYHQLQALNARLQAENAAIQAATISYNAVDRRYRNNRALLIELLSAQNKLVASQLNKVLFQLDIIIAQAALDRVIYNNN